MTTLMRAVQYDAFGGPDVLHVREVLRPRPGPRDLLVEVAAASVNSIDLRWRRGRMRLLNGRGFPKGTGVDFAGTVREVGEDVREVGVGERVWGFSGLAAPVPTGAAAQLLRVRCDRVSPAPGLIPLVDAAALPVAGLGALKALHEVLRVGQGDRLLVVGGNGGVGTVTIQAATALGASVDAVTGSDPVAALQAGAERTFDYHSVRPERVPGRYDAIVDAVGRESLAYRRLLAPGGRMTLITTAGPAVELASLVRPGPRIRMMAAGPSRESLTRLARAVDDGAVRPIIAERYPLEETARAHRDAEERSAAGKRVIVVQD